MPESYLTDLHASLRKRWRPEDVLRAILHGAPDVFDTRMRERFIAILNTPMYWYWSSMPSEFASPVGARAALDSVVKAFQCSPIHVDTDNPESLMKVAKELGQPVAWTPNEDPSANTHLNRKQRTAVGVTVSRRQYNRQWRALRRLNKKTLKLTSERTKHELIFIGRHGFTSDITQQRFTADANTAHFIAYWVARKNLRRQFTLSGRVNPMDEIAHALLVRCENNESTDWELIAKVRPTPDVLTHLTDRQKGMLLGRWVKVLRQAAQLLSQIWNPAMDRTHMVVRRGQDSSTWNTLASAYNSARAAWLACMTAMGAQDLLIAACPGKVMRLMAADLVYWHQHTGSNLDPNTQVWAALPLPWEVLDGTATCPLTRVEAACIAAGLDPAASGWTTPKAPSEVVPFALTPELVHGVSIADPAWAGLLLHAGVFSGKRLSSDGTLRREAAYGLTHNVVVSDLPVHTLTEQE